MGDALIRAKHYVEFRQKQATPEHFASEVTDALARVLAVAEAAVKEEASLDHLMDSPTGATYQAHIDARAATRTAIRALRGATEVGS